MYFYCQNREMILLSVNIFHGEAFQEMTICRDVIDWVSMFYVYHGIRENGTFCLLCQLMNQVWSENKVYLCFIIFLLELCAKWKIDPYLPECPSLEPRSRTIWRGSIWGRIIILRFWPFFPSPNSRKWGNWNTWTETTHDHRVNVVLCDPSVVFMVICMVV